MKPSDVLSTKIVEPAWIVENFLPEDYMVIVAGEAGAGKSVLMYNLAYAVASGQPFLGFKTVQHKVLYFDEENSLPDFAMYNQWAWSGLGQPDVAQLDQNLRLEHFALTKGWVEAMRTAIFAHQPGLVIVDTASAAFHMKDENDNAEAARVINQLRAMKPMNTTFIILKHERQRDEEQHRRTIRGAKVWLGSFDYVLYHAIAPRAKRRANGLRLTVLEPGKVRGNLAQVPRLVLDPSFTETEPKGLMFKVSSGRETSETN